MSNAASRVAMGCGTALLAAGLLAGVVGCDRTNAAQGGSTYVNTGMYSTNWGRDITGPLAPARLGGPDLGAGGAPTYGDATGTGFHTGDAAHSGGQGSGLMSFHGTGALGTSAAISDMHDPGEAPKNAPQWVLPEQ